MIETVNTHRIAGVDSFTAGDVCTRGCANKSPVQRAKISVMRCVLHGSDLNSGQSVTLHVQQLVFVYLCPRGWHVKIRSYVPPFILFADTMQLICHEHFM